MENRLSGMVISLHELAGRTSRCVAECGEDIQKAQAEFRCSQALAAKHASSLVADWAHEWEKLQESNRASLVMISDVSPETFRCLAQNWMAETHLFRESFESHVHDGRKAEQRSSRSAAAAANSQAHRTQQRHKPSQADHTL